MTIAIAAPNVLTVDELTALRCRELRAVFGAGVVPDRFVALNGRPKGRVLAVPHLDWGPLFSLTSTVTASRVFPWDGKAFASTGKRCGTGFNRINLLVREVEWFVFRMGVEPSVLDGEPCIRIDYDQPRNSRPVRHLKDELREVSPGLYLGHMYWKPERRRARTLLWFAIDTRIQC